VCTVLMELFVKHVNVGSCFRVALMKTRVHCNNNNGYFQSCVILVWFKLNVGSCFRLL
jgi:hypothetical protein